MRAPGTCRSAATIMAAIALSACASSSATLEPTPATAPASASPSPTTGQTAAIERARADSAAHPWTAADAHFMTDMIGHHAQAIVISRWAPTHSESRTIHTLAARIINAQKDEIALMQRWLRDREQPVPNPGDSSSMLTHEGHHMGGHGSGTDHDMMPGMLSDRELQRLEAARGPEFDRIFLTSMIKHHRGAVTMVDELFGSYGAAQDESAFRLATDINVDQITEINRMEQLLITLLTEGSLP